MTEIWHILERASYWFFVVLGIVAVFFICFMLTVYVMMYIQVTR